MSDVFTNGIIGEYSGNDFTTKATFTTFLGIALYNSLELLVLIFASFHRYSGLYFWSLLLSTVLGVMPQSLSFALKYYDFGPLWFSVTLSTIGWYFMVTGQALVLFSRLNIVGSNFVRTPAWARGYMTMERIQLTSFCLQEFIISGLYISNTIKILRMSPPGSHRHNMKRRIMYQLLAINALIIMMDVILLVFEYLNDFVIQTTLKSMVYSIKLKLEFRVLSRLVCFVQSHDSWPSEPHEPRESEDLL